MSSADYAITGHVTIGFTGSVTADRYKSAQARIKKAIEQAIQEDILTSSSIESNGDITLIDRCSIDGIEITVGGTTKQLTYRHVGRTPRKKVDSLKNM